MSKSKTEFADPYERIRAGLKAGDDEMVVEALRSLEEPRPNKILDVLKLVDAEYKRLCEVAAAGEGQRAVECDKEKAVLLLKQYRPSTAEEADRQIADIRKLEKEYWDAFRLRSAGEKAVNDKAGFEHVLPRLFGLPVPKGLEVDGLICTDDWIAKNNYPLEFIDGFVRTPIPQAPRPRRRRYQMKGFGR